MSAIVTIKDKCYLGGIEFKLCFIRNEEMNNTLSLANSTKLSISIKNGLELTIDDLPIYDKFDELGWVAMLVDEDKTNTTDPTPSGDYLHKYFCTIDRVAKTLTFEAGTDLAAWEVGDNLALYNPFLNYEFVGDQTTEAFINSSGAPAWRARYTQAGAIFKDTDGVYKWLFMGNTVAGISSIGYAYSNDMENWTIGNGDAAIIIPGDIVNCTSVWLSGGINSLGDGNYYGTVMYKHTDGRLLLRIIYFNEDFSIVTFGNIIFDNAAGIHNLWPSIYFINGEYHLSYQIRVGGDVAGAELTFAKASTLDGVFTIYQSLVKGSTANDGTPWSNNIDMSYIFESREEIFCFFGGTGKWSQGGTKGNRKLCLAFYDKTTEIWNIDERSPLVMNPLYWTDLSENYHWAADHIGGANSIFKDDNGDVYMTLSMSLGSNNYYATIIKLNRK